MSDYRIIEVKTKRDLRRFVKFPDRLYRDCPQYVPALHGDQIRSLTTVPTARYCPHKMWMVLDGRKVVGRVCGMVNPRYNEFYNLKRARFGWFDTIDDLEVARLLISTAEAWAKSLGMTEIHGPLYYNTMGKQGMLVEGYDNLPPFNCYYNFPYYKELIEKLGFEKECDWVQYKMNARQIPPEKFTRVAERLMERHKLHEGDVDVFIRDKELVKKFFRIYNEAFTGNVHNFVPYTDEEIEQEAKESFSRLSSKLCSVVLDENDDIAAFGIAFPSISKALQKARGSMFPFGWIHLLRAMKNYEVLDLMITGAAPKWQNTGISSVFHIVMAKKFRDAGSRWAISNPQIDTNQAAFVWAKYENELYMRRRCYLKPIE